MRWRSVLALAAALPLFIGSPAVAQTVPDPVDMDGVTHARSADVDTDRGGSDDIVVVGDNGSQFRLTGDALRDALRAFVRHRPIYAPAGRLIFSVTANGNPSLDGVQVYLRARRRLRDGTRAILDLPLSRDGGFELPGDALSLGEWDLRVAGARGGIRIRPLVLSPGTSIADRRFGDFRLQCRVSIAFARLSLPLRALAGAVGPCSSSRVALYARAPQALSAVAITGYTAPIDIRPNGVSFRVPLHESSIGNEARLRLVYRR
jgi:hypothetical protein